MTARTTARTVVWTMARTTKRTMKVVTVMAKTAAAEAEATDMTRAHSRHINIKSTSYALLVYVYVTSPKPHSNTLTSPILT